MSGKKYSQMLFFFFLFAGQGILFSRTLLVPSVYTSIQAAIQAAANGDTVLVAPGVYFENINFLEKRITVASQFLITGNIDNISSTIIDGSQPRHPDTASCVLMINRQSGQASDTGMALIGFTLRNGRGTRWEDEHALGNYYREGGGILVQYASPRIRNNIITQNAANDFTNCVSAGGGAIRCGDSNPHIANNIISYNNARYGAGIVLNYCGAVIKNNIIVFNTGGEDYAGGGLWILGNNQGSAQKIIENNTIYGNASAKRGGGFWISTATGVTLRNNIIYSNSSPQNYQIYAVQSTVSAVYNCVEGGYTGAGNITVTPALRTENFLLHDTSYCIDAGNMEIQFNDPAQSGNPSLAKLPSKGTVRNDIGAYGGPGAFILQNIINSVSEKLPGYRLESLLVNQNYPNPFNPGTVIEFAVKAQERVKVEIYNSNGQVVKTLADRVYPAGEYELYFNGKDLSSGIYFYKISTSARSVLKKMILLK